MSNGVNPVLYQINTRIWLNELSRQLARPATLYDVSDEFLDRIARQGFDWFWPLGVWQTGRLGRLVSRSEPTWRAQFEAELPDLRDSDICGSPFAVQAYQLHRDFGDAGALEHLRGRLRRRGVKLMLDFVPNHTARDHDWVTRHPQYYVAGEESDVTREPHNYARVETVLGPIVLAFGRDPYFTGWPDTFQLNYRSRECRDAMTQQLLEVSKMCDGARCDMAMLLLPDVIQRTWGARSQPIDGTVPIDAPFWPGAIAAVRSAHPKFKFMAEVYWDREYDLQQQGFDYTYDKRMYDRLRDRDVRGVRAHLLADQEFQRKSARFLENHDEPRAASAFPSEMQRAAAVATFSVPGLRFFHDGQLEGRKVHVSMHLGRRIDEAADRELERFYERLLATLHLPAMRRGRSQLLAVETASADNWSSENVIALSWDLDSTRLLVTVNYGPTFAQCFVRLPWSDLSGRMFRLKDRLSDAEYIRTGDDLANRGLYLDVPPWHPHIFEIDTPPA